MKRSMAKQIGKTRVSAENEIIEVVERDDEDEIAIILKKADSDSDFAQRLLAGLILERYENIFGVDESGYLNEYVRSAPEFYPPEHKLTNIYCYRTHSDKNGFDKCYALIYVGGHCRYIEED